MGSGICTDVTGGTVPPWLSDAAWLPPHPAQLRKVDSVSAYMPLIGFLALILVPLYIPIAVSIIGGVRRWREAVADARPAAAAMRRGSEDVVANAAWPVVEAA